MTGKGKKGCEGFIKAFQVLPHLPTTFWYGVCLVNRQHAQSNKRGYTLTDEGLVMWTSISDLPMKHYRTRSKAAVVLAIVMTVLVSLAPLLG